MERLSSKVTAPRVYGIEKYEGALGTVSLFIEHENSQPEILHDYIFKFRGVIDFRIGDEEVYYYRKFDNMEIYERGHLFEVENSEYIAHYLKMFPAAETIYDKMTHYYLIDEIGSQGVDILIGQTIDFGIEDRPTVTPVSN